MFCDWLVRISEIIFEIEVISGSFGTFLADDGRFAPFPQNFGVSAGGFDWLDRKMESISEIEVISGFLCFFKAHDGCFSPFPRNFWGSSEDVDYLA